MTVRMDSDEALHERISRGDAQAWRALYERYERPLFGFIASQIRDQAEAEDVLHETFMRLCSHPPSQPRNLRAWLYEVARNLSKNRLRDGHRRQEHERTLAHAERARPRDAHTTLENAEEQFALERALDRLPILLSQIYSLRAKGLSYEDIARELDVPLGTVKSRLHQTVAHLKQELASWNVKS
jgi:RNA polymerase sigma-70 factor (ECF subfamily)